MASPASHPVLYLAPRTRGGTTLWMNEEVGGPCEIRLMDLYAGDQKTPHYLALNPMGKVPCLVDGEAVVTEAAAICAYLADRFSEAGLAPPVTSPLRGPYYRWLMFAPSVIEPAMMDSFAKTRHDNIGMVGHGTLKRAIRTVEAGLGDRQWLLGESFSTADIVLGSALNFAAMFKAFEPSDGIAAYLDRLRAREAFQRAEARNAGFVADAER